MDHAIELVRDWHEAVNAGDTERLCGIVTEDVEIAGPRGSDYGLDTLIDWVERTGIRMEPIGWYQRGDTIVVCAQATWPAEDGTPGMPQKVVSVFRTAGHRITSIARYADPSTALREAGLTEIDRLQL